MNLRLHQPASWLTLIWITAFLTTPPRAWAQVPRLIRYQGQAVDSNSVPLEGPYTLTFRLYDAATAGNKLWEEIQTGVPLTKGNFSVLLGQKTALTIDWSVPCWLSVQVNTDPELSPRQQITSVPLAIRAETAEIVKTSSLTDDANRLVPSGAIVLWTSSSCPIGYSRLTSLDGKFLVSGGSFNPAAGGSNTHTHGPGSYTAPVHTHTGTTGPENGVRGGHGQVDGQEAVQPHYHSFTTNPGGGGLITGTSAAADSRPEFATVLLCQKD